MSLIRTFEDYVRDANCDKIIVCISPLGIAYCQELVDWLQTRNSHLFPYSQVVVQEFYANYEPFLANVLSWTHCKMDEPMIAKLKEAGLEDLLTVVLIIQSQSP